MPLLYFCFLIQPMNRLFFMEQVFKNKSFKGFLYASIAALMVSNVYIFSKAALHEVPVLVFGFYWYLMAFSYNILFLFITGTYRQFLSYSRQIYKALVSIAILELLAAITFFVSIKTIENPAIVSFLVNTTPVFVTLMSVPLLGEKFNTREIIGITIALVGAFILSYSGKFSFSQLLIKGANLALLSCIISAISIIIAKKNIKSIHPYVLSANRIIFIFFFFAVALMFNRESYGVSWKSYMNMSIGSFLGPFLGALFQYNSYKYIQVSKASLVQNTNGLFVIFGAFLYFGIFPAAYQIMGGIITIVGVSLMIYGKLQNYVRKKVKKGIF